MPRIELATQWMIDLANNPNAGYDQINRWGPNFDCSSSVITAWETAGVPVKSSGATYTGNMYNAFIKNGFTDVTNIVNLSDSKGMERGDVLLNIKSHTAMYIGNNQEVEASINELGKAVGGQAGDQTCREILVRSYRNHPWDRVLRYSEAFTGNKIILSGQFYANKFANTNIKLTGVKDKDTQVAAIKVLQQALNLDFDLKLKVDGILGPLSKSAIATRSITKGEKKYLVTAVEILLLLNGYDPRGVETPGIFGPNLQLTIDSYIKSKGAITTGIFDKLLFLDLIK